MFFAYRSPYQSHTEQIVHHLYHSGFQTGVRLMLLLTWRQLWHNLYPELRRYNLGTIRFAHRRSFAQTLKYLILACAWQCIQVTCYYIIPFAISGTSNVYITSNGCSTDNRCWAWTRSRGHARCESIGHSPVWKTNSSTDLFTQGFAIGTVSSCFIVFFGVLMHLFHSLSFGLPLLSWVSQLSPSWKCQSSSCCSLSPGWYGLSLQLCLWIVQTVHLRR